LGQHIYPTFKGQEEEEEEGEEEGGEEEEEEGEELNLGMRSVSIKPVEKIKTRISCRLLPKNRAVNEILTVSSAITRVSLKRTDCRVTDE
jgi:flagellar motor switch/type III secretory pathway protein FliN